jgi:2-oxoglutarate ferredoxin oxidoreductase subunit delta
MNRIKEKMNRIRTPYIWANPRKCSACWKCVETCPKQVIGRVGFFWHRHIVFRYASDCTGCKKCFQACRQGVFSKRIPDFSRS